MNGYKLVERREGGEAGFSVPVEASVTIGRSPESSLHLNDRSVSSLHAEIRLEDGRPVVQDQGSTNGVWVNGVRIQRQVLQSGDVVRIGIYEMLVVEEHPEAAAEKTILMEGPEVIAPSGPMVSEGTLAGESTAPEIAVLAGDATVLVGQGPVPPPVGRLACLEGPGAGKEYALTEPISGLGRAEDNTIHIGDDSLSRHHAEIVRDDSGGYTIRDKGSRNGTIVNGARIDAVPLKGGEEIVLGNTRFRFVAPGEIFTAQSVTPKGAPPIPEKKAPSPAGRKRLVLIGGVGGGVILLLLVVALLPGKPPPKPSPGQAAGKPPSAQPGSQPVPGVAQAPEDRLQQVRELYQQGLQAAKGRNWDEAIRAYDQALRLDSAFSLAKEAKAGAEQGRQVQAKMTEAGQLLNQGKVEEAATLAATIPAGTVYDQEIALLRKRVKDETLKGAIAKAEGFLKEKKLPEAKKALESAEAVDAGSEGVKRLQAEIASAEAEQKKLAAKAKKERLGSSGAPGGGKWLDAYLKGFLSESSELLRRAGDDKTASKVDQVKRSYEKGLGNYQAGQFAQAYGEWDQTLQIDREISRGKRSFVAGEIGRIMAREYVERGKAAFDRQDYEAASKNWQKALSVDPKNPDAEAGIARLDGIAQKLYQEGYVLESVNLPAAMAKWRQVVSVVPPNNPYHRKAAEKLRKYGG